MRYDVVIAGAGLAGACAAFHLSRTRSVLVLEKGEPGEGASAAAAGLANPFMGRKAKPAWRHAEALDALGALCDEAGAPALFRRTGVLRPAASVAQSEAFGATAEAHPGEASWRSPDAVVERWPGVAAPHGALWISSGGHVSIPALVRALLRAAADRGAVICAGLGLSGWEEGADGLTAITDQGGRLPTRRLLLALGDGSRRLPALASLPLHRIKGQTIRVARPAALPVLPPLSGRAYVVPAEDHLVVGATFEHDFDTLAPSPAESTALRARAARLLPALASAPILGAAAGVRVTVPGVRLPLLGPLPGTAAVWVFTGLGAKGLLTAPLLARRLPGLLDAPETIPPEVSTLGPAGSNPRA
ncbi:MAG: FAD-dependent oxidoreductase [Rubricoccaceae bacterium]|nr:FAD-dependent oxidoreductase [Rubricoccaceae bacterium]